MSEHHPGDHPPPGHEASVPKRSYLWWGLALLGVVMALAFSAFVMQLMGTIEVQDHRFRRALDSLRVVVGRLDTMGEDLRQARAAFHAALESQEETEILTGSSLAPRALARVMASRGPGSLVLIVSGLSPDGGRHYVVRSQGLAAGDSLGSFSVRDTTTHVFVFTHSGVRPGRAMVTVGNPARVVLAGAASPRAIRTHP